MFFDLKNMLKYFFSIFVLQLLFSKIYFLFFAKLEKVKIKIQHVFKVKKHVGKNKLFYKHVVLIY